MKRTETQKRSKQSDAPEKADGIGAALVSVVGRLILAFLLWVAVVAFINASPYAQTAPTAFSLAALVVEILLPIFALWPILAFIFRDRNAAQTPNKQ
jgi:hypothetical protein